MTEACKEFIEKMKTDLPKICTPDDLIRAGLCNSMSHVRSLRYRNNGPAYIKFGKTVIYPKDAVIEWLQRSTVTHADKAQA